MVGQNSSQHRLPRLKQRLQGFFTQAGKAASRCKDINGPSLARVHQTGGLDRGDQGVEAFGADCDFWNGGCILKSGGFGGGESEEARRVLNMKMPRQDERFGRNKYDAATNARPLRRTVKIPTGQFHTKSTGDGSRTSSRSEPPLREPRPGGRLVGQNLEQEISTEEPRRDSLRISSRPQGNGISPLVSWSDDPGSICSSSPPLRIFPHRFLLSIRGMLWRCAAKVQGALSSLKSIQTVEVDHERDVRSLAAVALSEHEVGLFSR